MPSNNTGFKSRAEKNYVEVQPIAHDIRDLQLIMKERNRGELNTLKAVNSLASESYKTVKRQQNKWNRIKNAALFVSWVLLAVTSLILYISPMLTQEQFAMNDARVWGMGALMAVVALMVAFVIDLGRSKILDKSNNGFWSWFLYIAFGIVSIAMSTTGMMAVADFYESSNQASVGAEIDTARKYMMDHAGMAGKSEAVMDARIIELTKLFHTKKSGYHKSDLNRDIAQLNAERAELKKYQSAKAVVEGKAELLGTTDSSNWLFNTYAKILGTSVQIAALFVGIGINIVAEAMALVAHSRLIKLNARLEVTDTVWSAATMAADRANLVANSSLHRVSGFDHFQHNFSLDFHILEQYKNNGHTVGDFIEAEWQETEQRAPTATNSQATLNHQQNRLKSRYDAVLDIKAGEKADCVMCGTKFTKKTYNHAFCKSKGASNCKDEYHNAMNPARIGARK